MGSEKTGFMILLNTARVGRPEPVVMYEFRVGSLSFRTVREAFERAGTSGNSPVYVECAETGTRCGVLGP